MNTNTENKTEKKGFWARLMDKIDAKMEQKAKMTGGCCCSSKKDGNDKKCC